jgi:uncharacterized protein
MDLSGDFIIAAPREAVWRALNDPDVLRACIPGCESVDKLSDTEFTAKVTAKVGPVKAGFTGKVTLSDIDPPNGYRISGEGKGGAAGFAKGGATVTLTEVEGGTRLEYKVDAQVGGKLAQIGSRLIDGTARSLAQDFFAKFNAAVADAEAATQAVAGGTATADAPVPAPAPVAPAPEAAETTPAATSASGVPMWVWVLGVVAAVGVLLALVTMR